MIDIPIHQIDAFASGPFTGNPAAVMPLDHWLDDKLLQKIAAENNLAETAFLMPDTSGEADYELRWFTPLVEVALCGHATLASGHYLLADRESGAVMRFRTRKSGVLTVGRDPDGGSDYHLTLPAYFAAPRPLPRIAAALGLAEPAQTLWHDNGYAMVVLDRPDQVIGLAPDYRRLAQEGDVAVICTAPGEQTDIVSRVFVPGAGIDEDPVTGSAHSVLTPYWASRLDRARFTAHQASARGGFLTCELTGEDVILAGGCVTVIEGVFRL